MSSEVLSEGAAPSVGLSAEGFSAEGVKAEAAPEDLLVRGVISRITYRNDDSGFAVTRVELESGPAAETALGGGPTTLVGVLPSTMRAGTHFVARGTWQTHPKFGRQFRARGLTETRPTGADAIQRYLGSGSVRGFGPKLAERIVQQFGEEALEILDRSPQRLLEVPGIGQKKLDEILVTWNAQRNSREVTLFFEQHGVPPHVAHKIFQHYGERSIEVVRADPYLLARDVWGIGFATADAIARALGVGEHSIERVMAGLEFSLKRAAEDGHCFLPLPVLYTKTAQLLEHDDEELFLQAAGRLADEQRVMRDGERMYLPALWNSENEVASCLARRLSTLEDVRPPIGNDLVNHFFHPRVINTSSGTANSIELSPQQQEAVRLAATRSLLVITGGPGCGKTTVVRTISQLFQRAGLTIKLAAPTGRAAQRLSEVCSLPASTIHRLLKYDPITRAFVHDAENPLTVDALIVDESSMVDITLAASLLAALPPTARLVVVGDADQLPSVGPGLFLADLLAIPDVPRVRLTTLFRRAEESLITRVAHEINAGIVPSIPAPDGQTRADAYFLKAESGTEAATLVERLVCDQIPKRFGFRGSDVIVLAAMNQGELGVIALNARLQAQIVPQLAGTPCLQVGNLNFRLGDRVCQRVNNYQITSAGVFNGDQGEVIGIDPGERQLVVKLWDGREITYPSEALSQLDLAYALTIHRSQGSEVPVVVLVLHESQSILLERQLLYTAVTRAKQLLIIVGTRRALALGTKKSRSQRRCTALGERVRTLSAQGGS